MAARNPICLLYGRGGMQLSLLDSITVLRGGHAPAIADPVTALHEAFARPIGVPALADLLRARRPRTVAITVSDITRPVPNKVILPVLLELIHAAGITRSQVIIIVGTGMHRASTPAERDELLGFDIQRDYQVIDHTSDDRSTLVCVSPDPPVWVNKAFASADFRIVTGLIEPHFMAGYSGGCKGVCPALVDLATVQRFHGHPILADARSDSGVLQGNPCHEESLRIARLVGVDFLVNVALDQRRQIAGIYSGHLELAHAKGSSQVAQWNTAAVAEPFDLVVTSGGGYPLDQTFYQTVKGMVGALPVLHTQSTLLVVSDCSEGVGSPAYTETMLRWGEDWRGFLQHIGRSAVVQDQWQYQMHARVLDRIGAERLWFVSDGLSPSKAGKLAVHPLDGAGDAQARCQRAIDDFLAHRPNARVAVIPEGPYTMLQRRPGREKVTEGKR